MNMSFNLNANARPLIFTVRPAVQKAKSAAATSGMLLFTEENETV